MREFSKLTLLEKEAAIARGVLTSILADLMAGGIDHYLGLFYTQARTAESTIEAHFGHLFEVLIYGELDFCIRDDGFFTLYDRHKQWWISPNALTPKTRDMLNNLRRPDIACAQARGGSRSMFDVMRREGPGGGDIYNHFKYNKTIFQELFDTPRADTGFTLRAHLCERMIYNILLEVCVNTPQEQRPLAWVSVVSHLRTVILQLTLKNCTENLAQKVLRKPAPLSPYEASCRATVQRVNRVLDGSDVPLLTRFFSFLGMYFSSGPVKTMLDAWQKKHKPRAPLALRP